MTTEALNYLESSVFLALVKGEPGRVEACRAALRDAETGRTRVITSAFTLAEVIKSDRGTVTPEAEAKIDAFFLHPWLTVIMVDRRVAEEARRLARKYGLKPPDAIHVATALLFRANNLFTYDDKILELAASLEFLAVSHPMGQLTLGL